MRPIKFRAWDKSSNLWVNLGLTMSIAGHLNTSHNEDYVLMQFTGLKDKNGKEIYEGDLMKVELPEKEGEEPIWNGGEEGSRTFTKIAAKTVVGEVRVNPKSGARLLVRSVVEHEPTRPDKKTESIRPTTYLKIRKADEVIGNIYENPELVRAA